MKTKIVVTLVLFLAIVSTHMQAAIVTLDEGHYEISEGSFGEVEVINEATLNMTGGYMGTLYCRDDSQTTISGGERLHTLTYGSSEVYVSGGDWGTSWADGESVTLGAWDNSNLFFYIDEWEPTTEPGTGSWGGITGTWYNNGGSFFIRLKSDDTLGHITFIPEPLSFFLFGAGVLFLSRKTGIRAIVQ